MTPLELELTNRWFKLYEEKDKLYAEKISLERECIKLKADYQSLKVAFEQKNAFLTEVLNDMRDNNKKENDVYRQLGALKERNRWLDARLAKCRQLFADDANKNNPNWPPLDMGERPPIRLSSDEEQIVNTDDDILDLFKQSSK